MKQYIGSKIVKAWPCYRIPVIGGRYEYCKLDEVVPTCITGQPEDGYRVQYEDGYLSWSPKDVFEAAYRETAGLSFGLAIEAMKKGLKVARHGWNGKGMFLYYVPAGAYPPSTEVAKAAFHGEKVPYGAYIAMKTAQGNVVPWLASQTDMLTDDWYIVE